MYKLCAFLVVLFLSALSCWGQSADRFEIFGGYSFAGNDFTGGTLYNNGTSLNRGWNASANIKINRFSQFVIDYGGYYLPLPSTSCNFGVNSCSSRVQTITFGPQFSVTRGKFTPFVHGLFGAAIASQSSGTIISLTGNHSYIAAVGGGVDYGLTPHFGLRAQADYLRTNFTNGDNQVPFRNNNYRISAGIVIRF